jgi:curved DNA-binding protein CbpA
LNFPSRKVVFPSEKRWFSSDSPLEITILTRNGRGKLMCFSSHSETFSMKHESFREVLASFLDPDPQENPQENRDNTSRTTRIDLPSQAVHEGPFIGFNLRGATEIPRPQAARRKSAYPMAKRQTTPRPQSKKKPEPLFPLEKLSTAERIYLEEMLKLGAEEDFTNGISMDRLKAVHRKLAKRLHPDLFKGDTNQFRRLQSAYEELRQALGRLESAALKQAGNGAVNDSAGDSEFASAPAYQRRDAA